MKNLLKILPVFVLVVLTLASCNDSGEDITPMDDPIENQLPFDISEFDGDWTWESTTYNDVTYTTCESMEGENFPFPSMQDQYSGRNAEITTDLSQYFGTPADSSEYVVIFTDPCTPDKFEERKLVTVKYNSDDEPIGFYAYTNGTTYDEFDLVGYSLDGSDKYVDFKLIASEFDNEPIGAIYRLTK
jgi:hypothetical protein